MILRIRRRELMTHNSNTVDPNSDVIDEEATADATDDGMIKMRTTPVLARSH